MEEALTATAEWNCVDHHGETWEMMPCSLQASGCDTEGHLSVASGPSPILKYDGCVYLSDTAPQLQRVIDERRKQHRGLYKGQMFEISPNFVLGLWNYFLFFL